MVGGRQSIVQATGGGLTISKCNPPYRFREYYSGSGRRVGEGRSSFPIATVLRLLTATVVASVVLTSAAEFQLWREHFSVMGPNGYAERLQTRELDLAVMVIGMGCGIPLMLLCLLYWRLAGVLNRLSRLARRIRASLSEDAQPTTPPADEIAALELAVGALQTTTRALRRSNTELEEFAYVVSHDLRSPLRAIQDLADWTIEDFGQDMPSEARRNLELIRARGNRLSRLLSELFAYARADSAAHPLGALDLVFLASSFEELLGRNGQFKVTVQGAAVVHIAVAPVRTILLNLVNNAITHHDRSSGRIVITTEGGGTGRITIAVRDDGPGIDPSHQERIFGLFRTLRSHESGATGFGLAYVRKLADRLDGTVSVVSDPDRCRGSEFRLMVPGEIVARTWADGTPRRGTETLEDLRDAAAA